MALYGGIDGGGASPMAGPGALASMLGRKRRKQRPIGGGRRIGPAMGGMGLAEQMLGNMQKINPGAATPMGNIQALMAARAAGGGMPGQTDRMGNPIDPGFNIQPGAASPLEAAKAALMGHAQDGGPGDQSFQGGSVQWGGKTFTDPNKLWGWEQKHGNTDKERFWRLHPDAARRLGMPVQDEEPANPLDPNDLKQGLVNQLTQAQGALDGTAIPGVHRRMQRKMGGGQRRIQHVGAAQGRAQMLAQIMSKRLRGGVR